MRKQSTLLIITANILLLISPICFGANKKELPSNVFRIENPDNKLSPYTGMTRKHWMDAAMYLLNGAFSYINTLDDPMKFPKDGIVGYPRNDGQIPTEKLEGFCRTLFVAAPVLRENSELTLNKIKVADYYRHQLVQLIDPASPSFIKHRASDGGPHQNLVEFGALSISLFAIPNLLWEPLTQEQKDALAATMLSYGDGPTVPSNWKFFNIFVLSFFKEQGYEVNESLLKKYLDESLAHYRGQGWYNDNPAYDYYSMWAFQMYGPLWSELFGKKHYPEYAQLFEKNLKEMADNYPNLFSADGKMIMWGRSICYRFGSVIPLAMTGLLDDSSINYGWMRRIASSTLLQFLQHPEFLRDNVPTLGFYGSFDPAVQGYSCRGSAYWSGKAFLALLLPEDNVFWTSKENNGSWEKKWKKNNVYNHFQEGSEILITNYPNSGASEIRAWCHVPIIKAWEKFRGSENYNKLAYNSEFPWMADGENGEVSMNYAVLNQAKDWEVLRMYTFREFSDGVYYRDAVLETNQEMKFKLADITLPNGILRVDKVISPVSTAMHLGHYSLPEQKTPLKEQVRTVSGYQSIIVKNGSYQQAMVSLHGWEGLKVAYPKKLHPESEMCAVIIGEDKLPVGEKIYVTLQLWKKGDKEFSKEELTPVKSIQVVKGGVAVELLMRSGETIVVEWP